MSYLHPFRQSEQIINELPIVFTFGYLSVFAEYLFFAYYSVSSITNQINQYFFSQTNIAHI